MVPENVRNNTPILILGMHRSGTSMLAGVLARLGLELGTHLIEGDVHNLGGHWEHRNIVLIHEQFLDERHSNWHDVRARRADWFKRGGVLEQCKRRLIAELMKDFSKATLWGVKDPRLCRLGPIWQDIFKRLDSKPRFILSFRNPAEVIASLSRRWDGFPPDKSLLLWLRHVLEAECWSRGNPRVFVSYDSVLADWRAVVDRIASEFKVTWPLLETAGPGVDEFVRPELRHHQLNERQLNVDERLAGWGWAAFDALELAQTRPEEAAGRFDEVRALLADYDRFSAIVESDYKSRVIERRRREKSAADMKPMRGRSRTGKKSPQGIP